MIFLQPDSKSSSRSKLHLQPILSFYITIFMPVIFSLFIRIYTVPDQDLSARFLTQAVPSDAPIASQTAHKNPGSPHISQHT